MASTLAREGKCQDPVQPVLSSRERRERAYFDNLFRAQNARRCWRVDADMFDRFGSGLLADRYAKDRQFALVSRLRPNEVLEMGCGSGLDCVLLARLGARVWAYDLSAEAIRATRRRAQANGVAGSVHVVQAANPADAFPGRRFDLVFGAHILHHLDPAGFDKLGRVLLRRLRQGGSCIFREPIIRHSALACLRRLVPWHPCELTIDEQPLTDGDIARLAGSFRGIDSYYYDGLARLKCLAPSPAVAACLHRWDAQLFSRFPALQRLASQGVWQLWA